MKPALQHLVNLMSLTDISENDTEQVYRGDSEDIGGRAVFGGQVLGQSVMASAQSVNCDDKAFQIHSMHAYFLTPGHKNKPIDYHVEKLRDGISFCTRQVVAMQGSQRLYQATLSYHVNESGPEHQFPAPDAPLPEQLVNESDYRRQYTDQVPEPMRPLWNRERPIEMRIDQPNDPFKPEAREPQRKLWLKAIDTLPDDPVLHTALLAYSSDFGLITGSMQPHGFSFLDPDVKTASLDHAIWFHRPLRMDDWLLYYIDGPTLVSSRGYNRGQFFNRQGELLASTAQEGLIRIRSQQKKNTPPSP